jgi:hypothetical protein
MPNENYHSDSVEFNPVIEPKFNSKKVEEIEDFGAARGGQFIEIQDINITKNDLMIISQTLHNRLDKLNTKAILLQEERDKFDVSSLEYNKINFDIKINNISIENTKKEIISNDDRILELEDKNNSLVANN